MSLVDGLSLNLPTTTFDYSSCAKLIKFTTEQLINLRLEKLFINIYNEDVSIFIPGSNIEPNNKLRQTGGQRITSTLDKCLTYSTIGASRKYEICPLKIQKINLKRVFFRILNNMNNEMIYID